MPLERGDAGHAEFAADQARYIGRMDRSRRTGPGRRLAVAGVCHGAADQDDGRGQQKQDDSGQQGCERRLDQGRQPQVEGGHQQADPGQRQQQGYGGKAGRRRQALRQNAAMRSRAGMPPCIGVGR